MGGDPVAHASDRNGLKAPGFAAGREPLGVAPKLVAREREDATTGKPVTHKRPIASIREANA
jgi:hypothetical protein